MASGHVCTISPVSSSVRLAARVARRRAVLVVGLTGAVLVTGCALGVRPWSVGTAPRAGATIERMLQVDGRRRSYLLHVPIGYAPSRRTPLVLVFHGATSRAQIAEYETRLTPEADHDTFHDWNMGGECCGYPWSHHVDDLGFVRAVVSDVARALRVDPTRVYAAGYSDGAVFSYRLACELSDLIAGILVIGGTMPPIACTPGRPVSVIAFHGTADRSVKYDDPIEDLGPLTGTLEKMTIPEMVRRWAERDACPPLPAVDTVAPTIVRTEWDGCAQGTAVALYTVIGGGHAWPGGRRSAFWQPRPTRAISAGRVGWSFLTQHLRSVGAPRAPAREAW
jgi:polyhydroxybutyrate depolymerase